MTATTDTTALEELKARQQKIWSSGDYGKIAWITVPLAEVLCDAAELRPGSKVLDVATGTGHVALSAARRFTEATGIDYVPELIATARKRAEAEGLAIDFREGDAENLPFDDESFDYVLSAIGVMFTAGHQRAADELVRVCRPGGVVGIASWTPTGFIGEMLKTVSRHVPPPPAAKPPPLWGTEDYLQQLLGDRISDLSCQTTTVKQRFPSSEFFADFFVTHYGPTLKAADALDDEKRQAFRDDLVALADRSNSATDGTVDTDWEYLVAVATKA